MPAQKEPGFDPATANVGARVSQEPISVCHIISGHVWAGAQVQVRTLLKALSGHSDLKLHSIVLEEGRLAQELRECGTRVKVIPQYGASLPRLLFYSAKCARLQGKRFGFAAGKLVQNPRPSENVPWSAHAFFGPQVKTQGGPFPRSPYHETFRRPQHYCECGFGREYESGT
jgi:hypothetical protein